MAHPAHGLPQEVGGAKEAVAKAADIPLADGMRLEADLSILLHTTRDRAEGIRWFTDRRGRVSGLRGVRPPRRVSQVDVAIDDFTQAQVLG